MTMCKCLHLGIKNAGLTYRMRDSIPRSNDAENHLSHGRESVEHKVSQCEVVAKRAEMILRGIKRGILTKSKEVLFPLNMTLM